MPGRAKKNDPRIYRNAADEAEAATKVAECKGDRGKLNLLLRRTAYHNDLLTAKAALEAGADPNSQNLFREGPMISLCSDGTPQMLHLFLKHGASLGPDKFGVQPIYHSVRNENFELISEMVKAGADVNAHENWFLETPLHCAVFCTSAGKLVKLLLDLGADPRTVDAAGDTPLEVAVFAQKRFGRNEQQVIKLLKRALENWKDKPPPKKPRRRPKTKTEKMADKSLIPSRGKLTCQIPRGNSWSPSQVMVPRARLATTLSKTLPFVYRFRPQTAPKPPNRVNWR